MLEERWLAREVHTHAVMAEMADIDLEKILDGNFLLFYMLLSREIEA